MKTLKELKNISPKYSKPELNKFDNENQFMEAYVELLKQTIELLYLIVGDRYCEGEEGIPKKINKEEAIIGGNLTRLIKLNTGFLANVCEGHLELCSILMRCIAETAINTQYMLAEGEKSVLRNYIKYSLLTEKKLWNTIKENIKERDGVNLDIENRMEISIQSSFEKSDFELDEINNSSKWKSIAKRAYHVAGDMFYNVYYGTTSHSIHGNWQDILHNNLKKDGDGFRLNLEWNLPKPQIMDVVIIFNLKVVQLFVHKEKVNSSDLFIEKVNLLKKYQSDLLETHESLINN